MTITIEAYDADKFNTEKVSFQLGRKTFHVGAGNRAIDGLGESPLWQGKYSTAEQRKIFRDEIQKYLPRSLADEISPWGAAPRWYRGSFFRELIRLVETYLQQGELKLIHTGDIEHAEMVGRCIQWLAQQISQS